MKKNYILLSLCLIFSNLVISQNTIDIKANFDVSTKSIHIYQTIKYLNTSNKVLDTIYLNDWSNSYSSKTTPLATRFAEEFKNTFHFAKDEDRGFTLISSIKDENQELYHSRLKQHPDVIKVVLSKPLQPGNTYNITLNYTVQVQNDKFTRYGISDDNNFMLRYWYITPAIFNGKWQYYSNKDLNDAYIPKAEITIEANYDAAYTLISELNEIKSEENQGRKITTIHGKDRINTKFTLKQNNDFNTVETDYFAIQSNIDTENLPSTDVAIITDRVTKYITENIGEYPHEKLLLTWIDYKKEPIYGLNLLPDFIRPFQDTFQYEMKILKTALRNYLENVVLINPREDQWVIDGIQTYFLIKYVEDNYPNIKLTGTLGNIWGIRAFHAADLKFNDQYNLAYLHMARTNLDQPLTMAKDSLLKYNKNIGNKYKAGSGLRYLNSYNNSKVTENAVKQFIADKKLKTTTGIDFYNYLKNNSIKNIDWFYNDFLNSNTKIDYRIKDIDKKGDSLVVTILNKKENNVPISLFSIKNDTAVNKIWVEGFKGEKTITIPGADVDRLALNYDKIIPEVKDRNNWKAVNKVLDKPIQFRLFKDVEDPDYSQIFFMPEFAYNLYDGFSPGLKLYNKTVLSKDFLYKFSPKYGIKSNDLVGSAYLSYIHRKENVKNFSTRYTVRVENYNYAKDLSYTTFTPSISFAFRDPNDLRKNKKQYLNFRYVSVDRDEDPTGEFETEGEPKYGVFNANYASINNNLKYFSSLTTDLQLAKDFGKLSATIEFRKLTQKNRQYNIRAYVGAFLYNNTFQDTDFFSFALDRPTDYLFDYDYLGRSEDEGITSQQLILAEGGFKSQLEPAFANHWISTINASTTIWQYIMAYGDVGFVKNHNLSPKFVYDAGIRLNLVQDYFELYLPVYSNKGWEIAQPEYDKSIRFIVTLSPSTLVKLFTRRWY
ncbi:metalloprotease [Lacinutrix sp. MedPE-SW]|uniref:metalloprotease n=1 Tax=Lacinutrix sp. MedPE-SW TaxID=1860087 RepID=UPI000910E6A6|nr:metalloprotease [Lacinutrix sp. MedPE-SW]OIQ22270.1 MAG: metalloprotease [Lacinutrix sp. MedPE-SW]